MDYKQITSDFSSNFFELIEQSSNIVITSHISADEDSIASVLSMFEILSTNYPEKVIKIIYSGEPEDKYRYFKNYEKIEFVPDMSERLGGVDLLIMLDGSQYDRFTKQPGKLKEIRKSICIDHHSSPIDEFGLSLVCPRYPSCTEIIYLALCMNFQVNKELAEIFLLGILGDTGNFTYLKPSQTDTLITAKKLLDIGKIEIQDFQSKYRTISKRVFNVVQEFIKNTSYSSSANWPDFQYSYIRRDFKENGQYSDNEISEASHIYVSNYLRTIENYPWGFVITPKQNGDCGISARSLPKSVSVRNLTESMKIGGGHDRAAGGTFKKTDGNLDVDECIKRVLEFIDKNIPVLV